MLRRRRAEKRNSVDISAGKDGQKLIKDEGERERQGDFPFAQLWRYLIHSGGRKGREYYGLL